MRKRVFVLYGLSSSLKNQIMIFLDIASYLHAFFVKKDEEIRLNIWDDLK